MTRDPALHRALSAEELSALVREPVERLLEWRGLDLIGTAPDSPFATEDVERVRLIQLALRRGISEERLARAQKDETTSLRRYSEQLFPRGVGGRHSWMDAATTFGVDPDLAQRMLQASGLGELSDNLDDEDVQVLKGLKVALDAGMPEDALLQIIRVTSDALDRIAENEVRLFHYYVHERLRTTGISGLQLVETTLAVSNQLLPLIEPTLLFFHRKSLLRANREDMLLHLDEDTRDAESADTPAQFRSAIVFVDLSSFTPLTATMGDAAAAEVLERFSRIVRNAVTRSEGRLVKQIGDAFMLTFPEPRFALDFVFDVERRSSVEPSFPAVRAGVHWGSVLYRDGDYVGTNVNIASRLAAEAGPHQVFVTDDVRRHMPSDAQVVFSPIGRRPLKGILEEVELFEAHPAVRSERIKELDVVCGMELTPAEVAARLVFGESRLAFCSEACLRRYVQSPESFRISDQAAVGSRSTDL